MDEKAEKGEDDAFEHSAFEALEKDFQEVLQELVGDKSLEHFRLEYEKLHRALKKSHESEKRLIKKCRELNAEIVSNAVKVQTALKLSQEDQATITALKKEIERAWKMVEASHEKEQRAKETIHNLKTEISNLSRLVEQGAGLSINQENMVNNLVQQKNDLIKHRDMLSGQVAQMLQQNQELQDKVQKLETEKQRGEGDVQTLREQLSHKKAEAEREQKRKERLDRDLKELRLTLEQRQAEIQGKKEEVDQQGEKISQLENQLKTEKSNVEKKNAEQGKLEDDIKDFKKRNSEEMAMRGKLSEDNHDLQTDLKSKQEEINSLRHHKERTGKMHEALKKKKAADDHETAKLTDSRNALKAEIGELTKTTERLKKTAEEHNKQIVDLLHERDILNKNVIKADDRTKTQVDLVKRHESQANTLAKDVQRWKLELQNKLHRVHELDKQREKYSIELNLAHGKFVNASEELKTKDNQLANLKKMITDVKSKLNQQKNLYEAVRTDKNLYSKNLIESLEEISEMRKKFRIMYHQIEQLKEEIKEKDSQLIKEHFEHHRVSKDSEKIRDNLDKATKKQKSLQKVVDDQRAEIKKLEATIQEAEVERQNQKKEFEGVTSERDILGTQLIRRNDELALLYEKIKIQQSTLQKGEIQYKERLDEIRSLKGKIGQLKSDLYVAKQQAVNIDDLKKEVYHLQRELLQERTKVKALSEELENPMNVHRWRKLEGSDPATYELIQKVKTLQKRLIQKTEEVVEKDLQIQEKEKLYVELKSILARQPGPEVREQLEMYEDNLQAKKKQMRAMQSELRTYQAQVGDYRDEIDRLTRELQEVKRKYFDQKKKEQVTRDSQRGDTKVIHTNPPQQPRFTGGGFNLSM